MRPKGIDPPPLPPFLLFFPPSLLGDRLQELPQGWICHELLAFSPPLNPANLFFCRKAFSRKRRKLVLHYPRSLPYCRDRHSARPPPSLPFVAFCFEVPSSAALRLESGFWPPPQMRFSLIARADPPHPPTLRWGPRLRRRAKRLSE